VKVYAIGLHRISYPAPAEIWPRPDMAARYEAGFDHILTHLLHCLISREFLYFTNLAICTYYSIIVAAVELETTVEVVGAQPPSKRRHVGETTSTLWDCFERRNNYWDLQYILKHLGSVNK